MDKCIFLQQGSTALIRFSKSVMIVIFQVSAVFKNVWVFVSFLGRLGSS